MLSQSSGQNRIKSSILDGMDLEIISNDENNNDDTYSNTVGDAWLRDLTLPSKNADRGTHSVSSLSQNTFPSSEMDRLQNRATVQDDGQRHIMTLDDLAFEDVEIRDQNTLEEQNQRRISNQETEKLLQLSRHVNNLVQQVSYQGAEVQSKETNPTPPSKTQPDTSESKQTKYLNLMDYLNQEYVQNVMILVFILTFVLISKTVISTCPCVNLVKDSPLKDAVYVLFREVVIVLTGALVLEGLNYYQLVRLSQDYTIGLSYCILMTLAIWTVLGLVLIIAAQKQVEKWVEYEKITSDYAQLEKIKKTYEAIYYRDQYLEGGPRFELGFIDKIKYFIMRLEFIHPIFLPPLSESFLRKDFNFAQYLAHSYGKTLKSFFNTSWVSLFFILIFVDASKLVYGHNAQNRTEGPSGLHLLNFLPPIFFLLAFLAYYFHFRAIERFLYPHIKQTNGKYLKPEEMNFHDNYEVVDPFVLYDNIPQPEYLEMDSDDQAIRDYEENGASSPERRYTAKGFGAPAYDQDEESSMMQRDSGSRRSEDSVIRMNFINQWDKDDKKNRSQCFGIYAKESDQAHIPNRHERLFFCGRGGQTIMRVSLQAIYILSIIYLSTYLVFSVQHIYNIYRDSSRNTIISMIIALIISPIIMFLIWILTIPQLLSKFTLITNIEMMKDRELIEKVIQEQKLERAKRSYRIFQVLKLIRREMALELKQHIKDKRLRGFTKKQIIEQYELLDASKSKSIKGSAIKTLIRLCGQELNPHEQAIMLKKSKSKGDNLKYKDFSLAVELVINDVKVDPYYLVCNLFQLFFRGDEKVEYSQFITFFGEFVTYFQQEDIDGFLREVQYIKRGSEEVYFQEIASMIRDDVELFPK